MSSMAGKRKLTGFEWRYLNETNTIVEAEVVEAEGLDHGVQWANAVMDAYVQAISKSFDPTRLYVPWDPRRKVEVDPPVGLRGLKDAFNQAWDTVREVCSQIPAIGNLEQKLTSVNPGIPAGFICSIRWKLPERHYLGTAGSWAVGNVIAAIENKLRQTPKTQGVIVE